MNAERQAECNKVLFPIHRVKNWPADDTSYLVNKNQIRLNDIQLEIVVDCANAHHANQQEIEDLKAKCEQLQKSREYWRGKYYKTCERYKLPMVTLSSKETKPSSKPGFNWRRFLNLP